MSNLRFTFNQRTKMLRLRSGRLTVAEAKLQDLSSRGAWIASLAVDEAYWRKGYGRLLTNECVQRARAAGCEGIALHVGVKNEPAIALYRR